MQRVNLYQDQFRRRRDFTDAAHLAAGVVVLVLLLVAVSGYQVWRLQGARQALTQAERERDAAQQRLDDLRSELNAATGDEDRTQEEAKRLRSELAAKRELLTFLESGPLAEDAGFSSYLEGLAQRVVEGVWLQRIRLDGNGTRIRLDGHARQPKQVPAFMAALGKADAFQGRKFRTLKLERPKDDGADVIDFVLASRRVQKGKNE